MTVDVIEGGAPAGQPGHWVSVQVPEPEPEPVDPETVIASVAAMTPEQKAALREALGL